MKVIPRLANYYRLPPMLNWISPAETVRVPESTRIGIFHYLFPGSDLVKPNSPRENIYSTFIIMPRATNKSTREQSPPPSDDHNFTDSAEASSSDHNQDPDLSFHPRVSPNQAPTMFMPYIEGPKMNWTVSDGLYHRFLKWQLKCKTILDCKLANLPAKQKWQKIIAWFGDFGMDLYVSWNIPKDDLTLDAIWNKFEEFSKPQTNEVRPRFDLLTSFCQGSRNVDEWYNAIQAEVNLAKYPPEMAKILHHDIFWVFMRDEDFVTKTINEGNIDIQKFPASKVCQLAKNMESSKATAKHIRQVAGDIPAAQVQLMHHQRTQLPTRNYPRRKLHVTTSWKLQNCKTQEAPLMQKTPIMLQPDASSDKCNRCSDTSHTKGFQCPTRKFQCKICHKCGHFTSVCFQKSQGQHSSNSFHVRKPKAQQLHAGALYTLHNADSSEYESGLEDAFCLQMKIHRTHISHPDIPKPVYLMANLAYCLQEHHTRNQYLQARLDTCANVNLMPMTVYCLMFKDPQLKKLTPSNMEIETYTTEVVTIIGMCHFYLVHPESKQLSKVMFFCC